jgi:hypothetical protein
MTLIFPFAPLREQIATRLRSSKYRVVMRSTHIGKQQIN